MASNTGYRFPSTGAINVSGALPANSINWSNGVQVTASDNVYANVSASMSATVSVTNWLKTASFAFGNIGGGLSISAACSIQGFELVVERQGTANQFDVKTCGLSLFVGQAGSSARGTDQGSNTSWTASDVLVTAGGPTNMLGMTTADASAGLITSLTLIFGFALRAKVSGTGGTTKNPSVDSMQMRIWYNRIYPLNIDSGEFGWEVKAETATSVKSSPWIYPTSVINISANAVGAISWANLVQAKGSADGVGATDALLSLGQSDYLAVFFNNPDLQLPTYVPEVSGAEINFVGRSNGLIGTQISAVGQFISAATFNTYPSGTRFIGTASGISFPVSSLIANTTAGTKTDNWGAITPARVRGASPPLGFVFKIDDVSAASSTGVIDTIGFRITYTYRPSTDITLSKNIVPIQSDYGYEALSNIVRINMVVQSGEYGFEATSDIIRENIDAIRSTYGFEAGSIYLTIPIVAQSSEYGFEAASDQITLKIIPVQSDYGFEATSDQITLKIVPVQSDYGYESYSTLAINSLIVIPCEYGFEASSPSMTQLNLIDSTSTNAEFGFEAASVIDRIVEVIDTAEFGFEQVSVAVIQYIIVQSAEFGFEATPAVLQITDFPTHSQYGYESKSVLMTQVDFLTVQSAELGFKTSMVAVGQQISVNDIGSAEFSFETGSPLLRPFSTGNTSQRTKRVRQI